MIDLQPKICNLCGGKVEYVPNAQIYGKSYGSGWCYHCCECGAYVGTHKPRPREALGILANKEMQQWKIWCHSLFDSFWRGKNKANCKRNRLYARLAKDMDIEQRECHFGYFDVPKLKRAYAVMKQWQKIDSNTFWSE